MNNMNNPTQSHSDATLLTDGFNRRIILMQGLPASGKTTEAKKICLQDPSFIRINRDDLRLMIYNYEYYKDEQLIKEMENACAAISLSKNYNIIIDGINFSQKTIDKWKAMAKVYNCDFQVKYIHCPLKTCIERDAKRENPVGEGVIKGIYNQYLNINKK